LVWLGHLAKFDAFDARRAVLSFWTADFCGAHDEIGFIKVNGGHKFRNDEVLLRCELMTNFHKCLLGAGRALTVSVRF